MAKKKLVILTGAGISAESGLQTFRGGDGLWEGHDVYKVATPEGFAENPELVLEFYNSRRRDVAAAKPNAAHIGIAALEKDFDVTIITQNIDDLHERAGSTNVMHLHGEIFKMRSVNNSEKYFDIKGDIKLGDLAEDNGQLRPHVVWFGEQVPMIEPSIDVVRMADIFVVVGTSLLVYPAAGLVDYMSFGIPAFIIDTKISYNHPGMDAIEKPATEGVKDLAELLKKYV